MDKRTEKILRGIGIDDPASTEPSVAALREWVASEGIVNMHVDWGPGATSDAVKARELMAAQWEIANGHSWMTEVLDCYPINRRFSTKTMRWHYEFRPDRIMPWVRDQIRRWACIVRNGQSTAGSE
jgi:hypothetical protein